jgi:hypothetical protein
VSSYFLEYIFGIPNSAVKELEEFQEKVINFDLESAEYFIKNKF